MKNITFTFFLVLIGIASCGNKLEADFKNIQKSVHKMTRGAPAELEEIAHDVLLSVQDLPVLREHRQAVEKKEYIETSKPVIGILTEPLAFEDSEF